MRDWGIMLGGLALWAAHFLGVYLVASLADLAGPDQGAIWTTTGLAMTGICLIVLGLLARRARNAAGASVLAARTGLAGCGVAALAIVWQTLPLILSRPA